jgi:hypothetical protein
MCKIVMQLFSLINPDDGGSKDLSNVGKLLPDFYNPEDSHLRIYSPPWEPQILL